ncbi:MAG: hypothetical protein K9G24_05735 [Candidatus Nanopelagicales bacterium]|nr:hypothetical protein [Candidatus Nanopelagicales bacterium]MCF8537577.1 hypothetical protein [Candidatus Nanopelagicales bacterium]MCF8542569.1 hypothetical protein [Candidatus Nanopelagicales bacterium]MCF8557395.1 hypothetical protein [Candidatus Nanopelagicales bacterium]
MEKRPAGVTVVGVIVFILGLIYIVGGLLMTISELMLDITDFSGLPIIMMLLGLIYVLVGKGLFDGRRLSQLVVGIVTVLGIIGITLGLFTGDITVSAIISYLIALAINLLILAVLFGARGRAFFAA